MRVKSFIFEKKKTFPKPFSHILFSEVHSKLSPVNSFHYYGIIHDFLLKPSFDSV